MAELNGDRQEAGGGGGGGAQVWDEIEETFLTGIGAKREREDREAAEKAQAVLDAERAKLVKLFEERAPLLKELQRIDGLVEETNNRITWSENVFRTKQEALKEERKMEDADAAKFLKTGRLAREQRREEEQRSGGWPVKGGPPPLFGPQGYYHQQRQPSQSPVQPQPLPQAPTVYSQRPRSLSRSADAENALPSLNTGPVVGVADDRRSNGWVLPSQTPEAAHGASVAAVNTPATNGNARSEHSNTRVGGGEDVHNGTAAQHPSAAQGLVSGVTEGEYTGVTICDSRGSELGRVKRLEARNPWIERALQLPIVRKVSLREGRKFSQEDLNKIYDPTDQKGTKWLACIIQAAGEVQRTQCTTCEKNNGIFAACVIVPNDPRFPRCANCEWARQACAGASSNHAPPSSSTSTTPNPATEAEPARRSMSRRHSTVSEPPQQQASGGFTAVNSFTAAAKKTPTIQQSVEEETPATPGVDGEKPPKKPRKSLPGGRTTVTINDGEEVAPPPPEKKPYKRPRKSLPEGADDDDAEADEDEDTEEITKSILVFRDDGVVYTEPEVMRGVPVEKIGPDHPYWDPSWPEGGLEAFITPTLEKWQAKYDKAVLESASVSSKYLANRQVNRGNAILKYLEEGPIHPLQIVAKRFVNKKLLDYDKIHRLVQILDEFKRFKVDVSPTEWVRHRLHQKFLERGDRFALEEEVESLYHDSKVRYIRKKSGFGNIGRPSGYRMKGEVNATPKRTGRGTKRKKAATDNSESPGPEAEKGEPSGGQAETKTPSAQAVKEPESAPDEKPPAEAAAPTPEPALASLPAPPPLPAATDPDPRPMSSRGRRLTRPPTADGPSASPAPSSTSTRASKRTKTIHPPPDPTPAADDLSYDGYTSVDSFSHDPIYENDWRIFQVKTTNISSNPRVTQYYHWVHGPGQEAFFEHQVLKDVIPARHKVTWGVYRQPYDFHLRVSEMVSARWAVGSLKIVAVTREVREVEWRGDVIVHFKRERTKRRFLAFLRRRGVEVVVADRKEIEDAWDAMDSQVLPDRDDDE